MDRNGKPLLPLDLHDRQVQQHLALSSAVAALIGYLYFGIGRLHDFYAGFLQVPNGSYSHAPLIPIISLGLIWMKRFELFSVPRRETPWAAGLIALALSLFFVGHKAELWRLTLISLILLLWSVPLYLWGMQVAKRLLFPVSFLFFAVPLNFLTDLTNPLKRFVSAASAAVLNLAGIHVERSGSQLFSIPHGQFQLEVADACSGINSLIALITLATVYGYISRPAQWQRWTLALAAIPLAMFGNLVRVTSSAIVGNLFGQQAIVSFDKFSTFLVFVPALAALLAVDYLLDLDYQQLRVRWFGTPQDPPPPR